MEVEHSIPILKKYIECTFNINDSSSLELKNGRMTSVLDYMTKFLDYMKLDENRSSINIKNVIDVINGCKDCVEIEKENLKKIKNNLDLDLKAKDKLSKKLKEQSKRYKTLLKFSSINCTMLFAISFLFPLPIAMIGVLCSVVIVLSSVYYSIKHVQKKNHGEKTDKEAYDLFVKELKIKELEEKYEKYGEIVNEYSELYKVLNKVGANFAKSESLNSLQDHNKIN